MSIERCQRCLAEPACANQIASDCLPVPCFGDATKPHIKVATIGLNPALNEFRQNGNPIDRIERLAILGDYGAAARDALRDLDMADARKRRDDYFTNPHRDWHTYFEKMESLLNRVNPAWTYMMGSAVHIDVVACATRDRWSNLGNECKSALIANCREYFIASLAQLPHGTVILCDGKRAIEAVLNGGLQTQIQPQQLINIRGGNTGDFGWVGTLQLDGKVHPLRGWTCHVTHLTAFWRYNLAFWLHGTLFPAQTWPGRLATTPPPTS